MLDERPMPRYLVGIPTTLQRQVYQYVENRLSVIRSTNRGQRDAEMEMDLLEQEVEGLKRVCDEAGHSNIGSVGSFTSLIHLSATIESASRISSEQKG